MGNCIKTQLKSIVDNDALQKLGVFRFSIVVGNSPTRNNAFHVIENNKSLFKIVSGPIGGTVKAVRESPSSDIDKGTSFYLDASLDYYTFSVAGTYVIEITEKYNLKAFEITESLICTTDNFKYLYNLQGSMSLQGNGVTGKLSDLTKASINLYNLQVPSVTGSLNDFSVGSVTYIILYGMELITGDISVFANNQTLSILAINGNYKITGNITQINSIPNLSNFQCAYNPNISGSLADLLDNGALINPNLKTLVINNTNNIVKNPSDVETLRSLGVDVTI